MTLVRITHLELRSPAALKPSARTPEDVIVVKAGIPSPELNRYLYTSVGGDFHWGDRLGWTWSQWMDWLQRPEVETWLALKSGTPAGFFELEAQDGSVEIVYFGVLPAFAGQGLGGYLLTQAVHRAFSLRPGVERVWLHTCTLDHPSALAGYQARGFTVFKEEEMEMSLPEHSPGPWPGAGRPG